MESCSKECYNLHELLILLSDAAFTRSRGSSVGIVSDYGLDDSIPDRGRGFFF
jgi:hypothetical protein